MRNIVKKTGLEKISIKENCLFTRKKIGPHAGLVLHKGKANSIIIGLTHAEKIDNKINTIDCDFIELSSKLINKEENIEKTNLKQTRAILTIVCNNTLKYKNNNVLDKIISSAGLENYSSQEKLKTKILFHNKIIMLSDKYNSKDASILYQTKTKTEVVSIKNKERIVELIGMQTYEEYFQPLIDLDLGQQRSSIPDIIAEKIEKDGLEGLFKILKYMWC